MSDAPPDVATVNRWRAVVARARNTRQRYEAVVSDPVAAMLVPQIPPEEFYYLVCAVGVGDVGELLRLASTDQIRTCLDLDAWRGDRVSIEQLIPWLEALEDLPGPMLGRVLRACDIEFLSFIFASASIIHERDVDDPVDHGRRYPQFETPDGDFVVEFPSPEREWGRVLERFLAALYTADPELCRDMLIEARVGLPGELEEESLRWRTARLADLGFPDLTEALDVYRFLDLKGLQIATTAPPPRRTEPIGLPSVFADSLADDTFLSQVLATIEEAGPLNTVTGRLVALLNRVLVADRVSPSDLSAVQLVTERARDTLSLGLEVLSQGDVERGRTVLERLGMVDVFRAGFSLTFDLHRRAKHLRDAGVDDPDLLPLLSVRPEFPCALDDAPRAGQRAFRTPEDLRRVAARLGELTAERPGG